MHSARRFLMVSKAQFMLMTTASLLLNNVAANTLVKYSGSSLEAVLGSDFTFTWKYAMSGSGSSKPYSITWGQGLESGEVKVPFLAVSQSGQVTSLAPPKYKERVTWTGDLSKQEASFTLSNVTRDDEAVYGMKINFDGFAEDSDSVKLKVLVPASFTKLPNTTKEIPEGGDLVLECAADGIPTPNVTWVLPNGTSITGSGSSTLGLSNIRRPGAPSKKYVFECRAKNLPDMAAIKTQTELTVWYSPEGTTLISSPSAALQGDTVTLTCAVTDTAPAVDKYEFYFNNGSIWAFKSQSNDGRYKMTSVRGSDQGRYKCVPSNSAGRGMSATFRLTVNVPPVITRPPQDTTVKENATLVMTCEASGQPSPTITWTKDGAQLAVGSPYRISSIKRHQAGTYTCTADNKVKDAKTASARVAVEYKPRITRLSFSPTHSSWIGQTVQLTCETDGVPDPNITLYKPDNTQLSQQTGNTSTTDVTLTGKRDFGDYRCQADNGVSSAVTMVITLTQIETPGRPNITWMDVQASSLTVRWTAPADNGGSPVTGYRVVIRLQGSGSRVQNINVGNVLQTDLGELGINTRYTVEVSAINVAGAGLPGSKDFTTKYQGVPEAASLSVRKTNDQRKFELEWTAPKNNGFPITSYTIYTRLAKDNGNKGDWVEERTVSKDDRSYTITLEAGEKYDIVVTANNSHGEAKKEDSKIQAVEVPAEPLTTAELATGIPTGGERVGGTSGEGLTIGVAVGAVLFAVVAVALGFLLWRRRSQQGSKGGRTGSRDALSVDDGDYASVSQRAAARQLRGEGASADVYAQVDKSKKTPKKPKRRPGEPGDLVYAELADFSRPMGGAVPVRPDQIERSDYADITQFSGQRRGEPTYDNLPRANANSSATYANVQDC